MTDLDPDAVSAAGIVTGPDNCPERDQHGVTFVYCPVKGCDWTSPSCTARPMLDRPPAVACSREKGHDGPHRATVEWT